MGKLVDQVKYIQETIKVYSQSAIRIYVLTEGPKYTESVFDINIEMIESFWQL